MASGVTLNRAAASNQPPKMGSDINHLQNEFIALFERDYPKLQECMDRLPLIILIFLKRSVPATKGSEERLVMGLTGRLSTKSLQTKFRQDIEAEMKEFQDKLMPMTNKMKDISQHIEEIVTDIHNPDHNVSYFNKYFSSANELACFIRTYDIGGLAVQISETLHLTGNITNIVSRVSCVLERDSLIDDDEVPSVMRKEFNQLRIIMEEIKKTKNRLASHDEVKQLRQLLLQILQSI